jgi:redox-sensitive bicupin YhaK (pirin superfamily)
MGDRVLDVAALGAPPWPTLDPFLFCVHHHDAYPAGNERFGPAASLAGHDIGQDFAGKDGWRMYHGQTVPGFPQHPHRGFETVTIVRRGRIDHSDSLGAAARFEGGDTQWLTAGAGIVHSEMFPLLDRQGPNPLELFQIWLNLPSADKLAPPHFAMLWREAIPRVRIGDASIVVVAGELAGQRPPAPPPRSWASRPDSDVAIWTIDLDAKGSVVLPPARDARTLRALYFFGGDSLRVAEREIGSPSVAVVRSDRELRLEAGAERAEILVLQGRPIAEPVAQYGPFVMNTRAELQKAFADYQSTLFGGWPWPSDDPVHPPEEGRFARHADGRVERVAG